MTIDTPPQVELMPDRLELAAQLGNLGLEPRELRLGRLAGGLLRLAVVLKGVCNRLVQRVV